MCTAWTVLTTTISKTLNIENTLPSLLQRESTFLLLSLRSWKRLILSSSHGVRVRVIIPAKKTLTVDICLTKRQVNLNRIEQRYQNYITVSVAGSV